MSARDDRTDGRGGAVGPRPLRPGAARGAVAGFGNGALMTMAAKQATSVLPIVFPAAGDPVASGLVTNLARPGGNVTGLSILNPGLIGKRLEQLKQVVPGVDRVAVLWNPGAYGERTDKEMLNGAEVAARTLGVRLQFVEVRGPADFEISTGPSRRWPGDARAL